MRLLNGGFSMPALNSRASLQEPFAVPRILEETH
jgi:hypothetical protein